MDKVGEKELNRTYKDMKNEINEERQKEVEEATAKKDGSEEERNGGQTEGERNGGGGDQCLLN